MPSSRKRNELILEIFLVCIVLSLVCLFFITAGYKMIVLNLFFLPVVLAGFFLGRYRAGTLALLCVIATSVATALDLAGFAAYSSPVIVALGVILWGAVLGLTALLVGTLSDERTQKTAELHEAYVGVVQVLSKYLQGANPKLEAQSNRVAELSQQTGWKLQLSPREIDDVRVAALLHDLENVEITSRVIQKAVSDIGVDGEGPDQHTFHGCDLARSLGAVLTGAMPLLLGQNDSMRGDPLDEEAHRSIDVPIGAEIIRAVRAYDALREGDWGQLGTTVHEAIVELRRDEHFDYHPTVLEALEAAVLPAGKAHDDEPVEIA